MRCQGHHWLPSRGQAEALTPSGHSKECRAFPRVQKQGSAGHSKASRGEGGFKVSPEKAHQVSCMREQGDPIEVDASEKSQWVTKG